MDQGVVQEEPKAPAQADVHAETLEADLKSATEKVTDLTDQVTKLRENHTDQEAKYSSLHTEHESLKNFYELLKQEKTASDVEKSKKISELETRITTMEEEKMTATQAFDEISEELESLKGALVKNQMLEKCMDEANLFIGSLTKMLECVGSKNLGSR